MLFCLVNGSLQLVETRLYSFQSSVKGNEGMLLECTNGWQVFVTDLDIQESDHFCRDILSSKMLFKSQSDSITRLTYLFNCCAVLKVTVKKNTVNVVRLTIYTIIQNNEETSFFSPNGTYESRKKNSLLNSKHVNKKRSISLAFYAFPNFQG